MQFESSAYITCSIQTNLFSNASWGAQFGCLYFFSFFSWKNYDWIEALTPFPSSVGWDEIRTHHLSIVSLVQCPLDRNFAKCKQTLLLHFRAFDQNLSPKGNHKLFSITKNRFVLVSFSIRTISKSKIKNENVTKYVFIITNCNHILQIHN